MVRRRKSTRSKGTTTLMFTSGLLETGSAKYIDLAQSLSKANRKLFRQGMCYYIHSVVALLPNTTGTSALDIGTIPDTWVSHKAWKKSFDLFKSMNKLVLEDSPNVEGKWHDYKVFFDGAHYSGGKTDAGPNLNLNPTIDFGVTAYQAGEWNMSTFVLPEHDGIVQAPGGTGATVLPAAADEFNVHMLGADVGTPGPGTSLNSGGIIEMYGDTRSHVQGEPAVPADLSTSWGTVLTDSGSQEPELSDIIETANDEAPYNMTNYQGGATNAAGSIFSCKLLAVKDNYPIVQSFNGFVAPLGLLKLQFTHSEGGSSAYQLWINLVPGKYGGVHATRMDA
jgi:hypothetical protein